MCHKEEGGSGRPARRARHGPGEGTVAAGWGSGRREVEGGSRPASSEGSACAQTQPRSPPPPPPPLPPERNRGEASLVTEKRRARALLPSALSLSRCHHHRRGSSVVEGESKGGREEARARASAREFARCYELLFIMSSMKLVCSCFHGSTVASASLESSSPRLISACATSARARFESDSRSSTCGFFFFGGFGGMEG